MDLRRWKITILVHNYARGRGLYGEHGLSLLIEALGEKGTLLFDSGQSGEVLLHNAERLGVDLDAVETVVLSHGHYDHTGGLATLLEGRGSRRVVAHPEAFGEKLKGKDPSRFIGSPVGVEEIRRAGWRYEHSREPVELRPDVWTTGEVPRKHAYEEEAVAGFYVRTPEGKIEADTIPDDLSLIILRPGEGFFLLCGCCHAGLINTLEHARKVAGEERILGVLGGLHTIGASPQRLEETFSALEQLAPLALYPLHCAGERESVLMQERFTDRTTLLSVGESVVIDAPEV
jgi:7,8-dihydropterin-6-yl-methyl-4-(beta-D-ribofuranosyl)aminobenzene 5'-phosphate synthase